jgi:beta-glucanase (GH16 family)
MRITLKQWFRSSLVVIALAITTGAGAQTLIWSDEFNKVKLDDEKWTREVGGHGFGNGELQYYTSGESNVFIGSKTNAADTGYLVIEARRENYGVPPDNRQFTSGRINTSGKFNFKYGTIEARMKLPNLQNGLWPAFWMLGANYPTVGWPRSGEIDIVEAGFQADWQNNVANKKNNSTVHWFQDNFQEIDPNAPGNGWWGNASATGSITIPGSFTDSYHNFKIVWTPTAITGFVDNVQYYNFTIPQNDPNITEFNNPFYFILNLAVGGTNFVGITDPALITAPMPAQVQVDYIRVYSNANTEFFSAQNLPRQTGTFGVYTETKPVNGSLGAAPTIEVWSNLVASPTTAYEGSNVLSFTANPGNWFGMGIPTGPTNVKNMQNFVDGKLYFHMKTTSQWPLSVGFVSTINGNAQGGTQNKTVRLDPAGNQYGLVRDGQWHEVAIPLSAFGNVEFRSVNNMFYIVGDNPSAAVTFAIDNIYWQDGTKITPQNGDYVLYSDTKTGVDKFDQPVDGSFFVWEQTMIAQTSAPAEGANVLSFTHNNKGWFGAAFTANAMHNLTAYKNANARLVLSLKTSDTTTPFFLGMKSGTRDGEGQKWIAFQPGTTPYGFTRNGTWQTVQIPLSDFYESVNMMEVTQVLQLLGTGNIANIAIDNIYFTGGGAAEPDGNAPPVVNAGADKAVTLPASSVVINGSATDADGTITAYAWTRQSGPNTPSLTGANTANLTANGLIAGTYLFRLTATDNQGTTAYDEVNVVVSGNTAPTANAGADKAVTLPTNSVVVNGTGTDPGGSITAYAWTRMSGPNTPTLTGANTANLTVSGLIAGTYVYRLTVTDNGGVTGIDDVNIVVSAAPAGNLALNKPVTVSTIENAGTPGSAAVDGNAGTRWASAAADPQWIYVDLGTTYSVNRVKITWETALGRDYLVQIAAAAAGPWTTLKTITGNTVNTNDHTGLSGSGRFVRIYGTVRGTQWGYSIWELEVYGASGNVAPTANAGADKNVTLPTSAVTINGTGIDSDGTIASYTWTRISGPNTPTVTGGNTANMTASGLIAGTYVYRLTVTDNGGLTGTDDVNVVVASAPVSNLALNKPATVSSTENAGTPGAAAVDGNIATRWSSAFADPQWIYIDLGSNYNINRVKLTWETASARDYQVQIGTTTSAWTTLRTVTNNTTLINDHTGLTGTGRYLRIYCTARTTAYGNSIFELEAYGTAAARMATEKIVVEADADVVVLYPNPAVNIVHVQGVEDGTPVRAFTMTGSRSFDYKVTQGTIDVTNLPTGSYVLDFNLGLKYVRKKLIKL